MSVIVTADALPKDPLAALRVLVESEVEIDRIRRAQVTAARSAGATRHTRRTFRSSETRRLSPPVDLLRSVAEPSEILSRRGLTGSCSTIGERTLTIGVPTRSL